MELGYDVFFGIDGKEVCEFNRFKKPKDLILIKNLTQYNKWLPTFIKDKHRKIEDFDKGIFIIESANVIVKIKINNNGKV